VIYVLIGILGGVVHFKEDKKSFWLLFILFILLTFGLVFYLNHEFSISDPNPAHRPREPRERDYFWGAGFFLFMFYVSIGLYWIWNQLRLRIPRCALGVLVLAGIMGFIPLVSNIKSHANRRGNWIAHDYARALLVSPEENSILFVYGDNDTFPVWFLQGVKDFRMFDAAEKKGVRLANFSLMNTNWYVKQLIWSDIPIDLASPFRRTIFGAEYIRRKRSGRVNVNFDEWIVDTIPPAIKLADGRILELKDMAVKSMILSSLGKETTFEDLTMRLDLFVKKYINEDFDPSVNFYFSFPIPRDYREAFSDHLLREGLAYKLVKDKVNLKSNKGKSWDLFSNQFSYSYYDNFWMCIGSEAQVSSLINFAISLFSFSDEIFRDIYPSLEQEVVSESLRDTLMMLESLLRKVIIYSEEESVFLGIAPNLIVNQKLIYRKLGNYDEGLQFVNTYLEMKDVPRLRLLRGELLTMKARVTEDPKEAENLLSMAEEDFNELPSTRRWKPLFYKGLAQTYILSGEEEKLENLVDEFVKNKRLFTSVFMLLEVDNLESAIELIKRVKNRFPDDRHLDEVLDSLEVRRR
jgi:hypothetical protein